MENRQRHYARTDEPSIVSPKGAGWRPQGQSPGDFMPKPNGRPYIAEYDNLGKTCLHCGAMFYLRDRPMQSFGKFQKRKYCSVLCANLARGACSVSSMSKGIDADAFWRRTQATASGCLEWTGRKTAKGYGQVVISRRDARAHRIAFTLAKGPIPEGMMVLHSCDNPPCCNPAHLRIGTAADNWADVIARNRRSPNQLSSAQRLNPNF